ncbi:MAG TPA: hypothetical protein VGL39_28105 [Jatrophihabitantaceae bacterium]|jgi:hypothetical protein
MAAVHEVIARDGTCLYRGRDIELACEIYSTAPAGTRLRCRRVWTAGDTCRGELSATDVPVPYRLTAAGYAATSTSSSRRADPGDASARAPRDGSRPGTDEPVPYALTARAAEMFVVDTANVTELRRRCPELFVPRNVGGAS